MTKEYPYINDLYKLRYGFGWLTKRRPKYLEATNGECCLCASPAREVHHAHYRRIGVERVGIDVFPLCLKHHNEAHLKGNWIFNRKDPLFGNRNTDAYLEKLQNGYLMKLLSQMRAS